MPEPQQKVWGDSNEADVDHVNIWMRNQSWYQKQLREWGMDPAHPGSLAHSQREQLVKLAQANGVVVDEGHDEIDDHGNFHKKGHKLRNTLIVAGIAAATIATMGAAGMFAGPGIVSTVGTVGTEAASAAGVGGATAAGAFGPMAAGYAGATTAAAVPSSLAAVGGGLGTAATIGNALKSGVSTAQQIGDIFGAAGKGIGSTTDAAHDNRITQQELELRAAEDNARNLLGTEQLNQSGQLDTNRLNQEGQLSTERLNLEGTLGTGRLNLDALLGTNRENIEGQSAFETELMNRAKLEEGQRGEAKRDVYRASAAQNPRVSPFDPAGAPKFSHAYMSTLSNLEGQGVNKLKDPAQYDSNKLPGLKSYSDISAPTTSYTPSTFTPNKFTPNANPTPITPGTLPGGQPSTGEKVGNWLGPGLSVAEQIARFWASRGKQ